MSREEELLYVFVVDGSDPSLWVGYYVCDVLWWELNHMSGLSMMTTVLSATTRMVW